MTDQAAFYRENDYLAVPGLLGADEVAALRHEAAEICRGNRGDVRGLVAADGDDDAVMRQFLCIHFPHKISQLMLTTLSHPGITEILGRIVSPNVKCMQSMLFIKHAGKPGQAWHQDEHFIPTRDRSLTGVWIALDDANVENGCLWVHPGSHRPGVLWPTRDHGDYEEFDEGHASFGYPWDDRDSVPLEIEAGGVLFFNGYLLHRSLRNRSTGRFRRALVNHCMSAESYLPWDWDGRIEPVPRDMRDIVLVRGKDPYSWRGTEDITFPYLRAERPDDPNADPRKRVF